MKEKRLYAAYGSNLNLEQMAFRCPTAKLVGTGKVMGYEFQFRGSERNAHATIVPKKGASVPVAVWELGSQDEMSLDRYEGYPSYYFKRDVEVALGDRSVTAMAYLMDLKQEPGLPSSRYYDVVREGYLDCGFDEGVLVHAYRESIGCLFRQYMDDTSDDELTEGGMKLE